MKKKEEQRFYWSDTNKTLDAWTGGGFYRILFKIELFGFRLVLWKAPKFIDISKEDLSDHIKLGSQE